MRHDIPVARVLLAFVFTLLAAISAQAAPALKAKPPRLPVEVLPWVDDAAAPTRHDTTDLPGTNLRAGTDWWALACEHICSLQPLKLASAKAPTVNPQYSGETPSQRLSFVPAPPHGTLLLFRPLRPVFAKHPLKAGPVPSGHPVGDTPHVRSEAGLSDPREVFIDGLNDEPWLLSPTLLRPGKANADASNDTSSWPISLDLRVGRHHQSLGMIGSCGELPWRSYLRWAGDLDGDGRPDFVVQLDLAFGGEIVLYLSSLAGPGQFVGEAGHSHLMFEGEC